MGSRVGLAVALVSLLASCGGAGATTTQPDTATTVTVSDGTSTTSAVATTSTVGDTEAGADPCALATGEQVATSFGAASATGEPGVARNCHFTIEGGVAGSVEVFHFGSSAGWDGVKAGYEENRGGVTAIPGLGEEAYQPNDVGPYEVVVRSGDVIFAVAVQEGQGGPEVEAAILDLAAAIASG